jgi:hypothetical protein
MGKKPPGDVIPPAGPEPPAPPPPPGGSERSKAYKLRQMVKAGQVLLPSQEDWLREYEANQRARGGPDVGASASEKVIHVEERTAAVGTGDAATYAAGAAAMAKEEGKRLDALIAQSIAAATAGITSMQRACELHESMAATLLADRQQDREEMRTLMASIRTHYLARIDAEGAAAKAQQTAEGADPLQQVLQLLGELRAGVQPGPRVVPGGKTG